MIFVINGEMTEVFVFSRADGKGSRAQVVGFVFLIICSTSSCVTSEKEQRGWTISDGGSMVVRGRTAVAERCERILSTFCL